MVFNLPMKPHGNSTKVQRRKTLRRRNAPRVVRRRKRSAADANEKIALLESRLNEALEQQTATSEVLKVISRSRGQLEPVFNAMLEKAVRICGAKFGQLFLSEDDGFRMIAMHDVPRAFAEKRRREPFFRPSAGSPLGRVMQTRQVAHIVDVTAEQGYADDQALLDLGKLGGARTTVAVPLLNGNELVGAISIYHKKIHPFTDKQIELLAGFATQAVIAIENTRLLNELRESLQQQTATADVLKVISSSPGELKPVFQAMLEQATRICDAKFGIVFRYESGLFHPVAWLDVPPAFHDFIIKEGTFAPKSGQLFGRLCESKLVINIVDRATDRNPSPSFRYGGARSSMAVPLLNEGELGGAAFTYRTEGGRFTDRQIELVKNFAAQAVIAIENTRLLNELRDSLDRQTATAEVLKVISSSPGELTPVFDSVLANATQLCEASHGAMWIREGDGLRNVAFHGTLPEAFYELWHAGSVIRADAGVPVARSVRERRLVIVEDLKEDKSYRAGEPLARGAVDLAGMRTLIAVPMVKEKD